MMLSGGVRIILPPLACFEVTGVQPKPDIMEFAVSFTETYPGALAFREWLFKTKAQDWKEFVRDEPIEIQTPLALGTWFNDMYIRWFNSLDSATGKGQHRYANDSLRAYLDECYVEFQNYINNTAIANENNPGVPHAF